MTHLALLRGINVGGRNKLPMKDLAAMFAAAGCRNVQTFIQSGNVVFSANERVSRTLAATVAGAIAGRFGFNVPVILRTTAEMRDVVNQNPFAHPAGNQDQLHVMFLADTPGPAKIAALDPDRSAPDAFAVRGRDIYLRLENGVSGTKLTNAWFDSKLTTVSTARNWRTVTKLFEMLEDPSA